MMFDFIVYINGNISQIMPKGMKDAASEMRQSSEAGEHGDGAPPRFQI